MHLIVLGSGVIGVSTAYYLAKKGFQVSVYDRQPGPALETSYANAGQLSPGYASPWAAPGIPLKALKWLFEAEAPLMIKPTLSWAQYRWLWQLFRQCNPRDYAINKERMVRLSEYSRQCMQDLRYSTGIRYEDRQQGTIQLFRTQAQLDDSAKDVQVLQSLGTPFELLDRNALLRYEPGLRSNIQSFVGGLRLPQDETGDCYLFTQALMQHAQALGVQFHFGCQIEGFEQQQGRVHAVRIDGQSVKADAYVVAMGAYSTAILSRIGIKAPIYPLKGFSLTVPIIDEALSPVSTVLDETYKVALTRFDNRIRMGGMAGVNGFDLSTPIRYEAMLKRIFTRVFPGAGDLSQASFWTGLRPATPDGTPIVGKTSHANIWMNAGHGTLGWTMACGSAACLADQIAGQAPNIRVDDLAIARYA